MLLKLEISAGLIDQVVRAQTLLLPYFIAVGFDVKVIKLLSFSLGFNCSVSLLTHQTSVKSPFSHVTRIAFLVPSPIASVHHHVP